MSGTESLSSHMLMLKKSSVVLLLCCLEPKIGHVNGSWNILDTIFKNVQILRTATESSKEYRLNFQGISCVPGNDDFSVLDAKPTQFPVLVCFVSTTTKLQGQSFKNTIVLFYIIKALSMANCMTRYRELRTHQISVCSLHAIMTKKQVYFTKPCCRRTRNLYRRCNTVQKSFSEPFYSL